MTSSLLPPPPRASVTFPKGRTNGKKITTLIFLDCFIYLFFASSFCALLLRLRYFRYHLKAATLCNSTCSVSGGEERGHPQPAALLYPDDTECDDSQRIASSIGSGICEGLNPGSLKTRSQLPCLRNARQKEKLRGFMRSEVWRADSGDLPWWSGEYLSFECNQKTCVF